MILSEYIKTLQELPQDAEVYVSRGEWGPVAINERNMPAITPLYAFRPKGEECVDWFEDFYPEVTGQDEDYIQKTVVVL